MVKWPMKPGKQMCPDELVHKDLASEASQQPWLHEGVLSDLARQTEASEAETDHVTKAALNDLADMELSGVCVRWPRRA